MHTIGADEQIGLELSAIIEGNHHAVAVVGNVDQCRAEPQIHLLGQMISQHLFQIGPHDAAQPALDRFCELPVRHTGAAPTVVVNEAHLVDGVRDFVDRRQQAHRFRRIISRAEEVDHVTLRPRTGCPLQQYHLAAECRDPACQ